jgi:hypothetical protein
MTNPVTGTQAGANSAISQSSANAALSYTVGSVQRSALLRCSRLSITYGLESQESHARQRRAFYPHRRNQGTFALTFDHKGWREYSEAMTWFQAYARSALDDSGNYAGIAMAVSVPARGFTRSGIPTTGMEFGDHTGSMVFSPTINFISVHDPNDNQTGLLGPSQLLNQISRTQENGIDPLAANFFYPDSAVNTPGKLDENLYGPTGVLPPPSSAAIQALLNSTSSGPLSKDRSGSLVSMGRGMVGFE